MYATAQNFNIAREHTSRIDKLRGMERGRKGGQWSDRLIVPGMRTCPPLSKQRLTIDTQDIRSLLDRVGGIRHACDLDLMLFFYRHPRALLTSDRLAICVGYDREPVARALDGLIAGGLLAQIRSRSNTVNLYVLELGGLASEALASLLEFAVSRDGRLGVMRLLTAASDRPFIHGGHQSASLAN